ncbi:hypothetical protein ACHAXT_011124 [Thalassiosira profunda]
MRAQGGMSLQDLKRQTALRLADGENNPNDASSESPVAAGADQSQTMGHNMRRKYQQHPVPTNYGGVRVGYTAESRNYTDSQLGPLQQQYSTPRMPRHAAALKDRGSAENSVGSDPSGGSGGSAGYGYGGNRSAMKGHRTGSYGQNLDRAGANHQPTEMRSPDGRHTPVRDTAEGHVLFNTPNQRREVPSTPYTEPSRRSRPHQNSSPNFNRAKSPDHYTGGQYPKGGGGGYYNTNQPQNQHAHSKLPHGLTVQELKEMTRARLATEAETMPTESSDQSVHSAGTHGSSKGGDGYLSGRGSSLSQSNETVTRNLVQSNESIRRNSGLGPHPFGQAQRPRHPSPIFGTGPGPDGLSSSQTWSMGEMSASRDVHTPAEASFHTAVNSNSGGSMPFASPMSDSNAMSLNRARCFSAGATLPSSFDRHQAAYYGNAPLVGDANRQRCATASPPGMARVHEDQPFLFSTDDKTRLAIPPLSEPRMRLHSTGGLNTHSAVQAFNTSVSPPPNVGSGSAFMPIGKSEEQLVPPSPPPMALDRSKFGAYDRTVSSSSATSAHGDLPSSMAEAVLEKQERLTANSPYRPSSISDNASSRGLVGISS